MRSFSSKSALLIAAFLIIFYFSCAKTEQASTKQVAGNTASEQSSPVQAKRPQAESASAEQEPNERPVAEAPPELPNTVAKIGDYFITKEELEERLRVEIRPAYEEYSGKVEPVDAKTVLMKMIAEKAMVIDARKQNLLEDKGVAERLKQFRERGLVDLLLRNQLQGKLTVTDAEIEEKMKASPKLTRERAEGMLKSQKARKLVDQFYDELYKKRHVRKFNHNFPKVVRIHQGLLLESAKKNRMAFIRIKQVKNLPPEEKNVLLAVYEGGIITLKDWFDMLCESSPPSRPKDLNTVEGVERLLDRTLRMPLFVAEAKERGLEKDEDYQKRVKYQEDMRLLGLVRSRKFREVTDEISDEEIVAHFNENKRKFAIPPRIKIDQIWCQDFETARQVKAELTRGKDFEAVKQEYSVAKETKPFNTVPAGEGVFFDDLWRGQPNDILGPIKGFYGRGLMWRVVKILEKKPSEPVEFSDDIKGRVKESIRSERRQAAMDQYRKELFEKHQYKIYAERLAGIDPFRIR